MIPAFLKGGHLRRFQTILAHFTPNPKARNTFLAEHARGTCVQECALNCLAAIMAKSLARGLCSRMIASSRAESLGASLRPEFPIGPLSTQVDAFSSGRWPLIPSVDEACEPRVVPGVAGVELHGWAGEFTRGLPVRSPSSLGGHGSPHGRLRVQADKVY